MAKSNRKEMRCWVIDICIRVLVGWEIFDEVPESLTNKLFMPWILGPVGARCSGFHWCDFMFVISVRLC
jgi:hypothetical protein